METICLTVTLHTSNILLCEVGMLGTGEWKNGRMRIEYLHRRLMQLVCGRMAEDWYESIVWEMVWENGRHRTRKQGRMRVKCKTRKQ